MPDHAEPTLAQRMARAGVGFGTSGTRGRVEDLDNSVCYALAAAFAQYLAQQPDGTGGTSRRIAIAGDRRASTPRILAACTRALTDRGMIVVHCGRVPTPALAAHALAEGIPGLMVTGSHIPEDRNGIKLYTALGEILKPDEVEIAAQRVGVPDPHSAWSEQPPAGPTIDPAAERRYVARFVDAFGNQALRGLSVGAYGHSAVGRDLTVQVLRRLGAQVVPLGFSETFVAVDTEAIRREDRQLARQWAAEQRFDAIVTTDGDGDRPMLADASGHWLRGDIVGVLAAATLGADVVVTPVSSNTVVERSGLFRRVVRTRIGSPYVIARMQAAVADDAQAVVLGYEANGGLLQQTPLALDGGVLSPLPTRDAMIVLVAVLHRIAREGCTLAELAGTLPARFTASDRLAGVDSARSLSWIQAQLQTNTIAAALAPDLGDVAAIDCLDGVRLTFGGGEIVHLRPSGNAPELRCYCEAEDQARADALVAAVLTRVGAALGCVGAALG